MRMTRKIRRAWLRGKPEWAKCYLLKQRLRRETNIIPFEKKQTRLHKASRYLVAGVMLACLGIGNVTEAAITTADGAPAGSVVTNGNITNVYNQQVNGGTALNKFTDFDVSNGHVANLQLDAHDGFKAADRQINLVKNKINVDGVVNAFKNGQIGGDIYFFSNNGMAVGATGVINVGRLTVGTSTHAAEEIYKDYNAYDSKSAAQKKEFLITDRETVFEADGKSYYKEVINNGTVQIDGAVNSIGDITLAAKEVLVGDTGSLNAGATFQNGGQVSAGATADDYRSQIINLTGVNKAVGATATSSGDIVLFGKDKVDFDGDAVTNGGNFNVNSEATISFTGNAENKATVVTDSGDIAINAVRGSTGATNVNVSNAVFDASDKSDNGTENGDVKILAETQTETYSWAIGMNSEAKINVSDSAITGDNVNIFASATNTGVVGEDPEKTTDEAVAKALEASKGQTAGAGAMLAVLGEQLATNTLGEIRTIASYTDVGANAEVHITESDIEAIGGGKDNHVGHGYLNVKTDARSDIRTVGLGLLSFSFTFGESDVKSKVIINDSYLEAHKDVTLNAFGNNNVNLSYLEVGAIGAKLLPVVAGATYAEINSDVRVEVDTDSNSENNTIIKTKEDFIVNTTSNRALSASVTTGSFTDKLGVGVAIGVNNTKAEAIVNAKEIYAGKDVSVTALNTVAKDKNGLYTPDTVSAESLSGNNFLGKPLIDGIGVLVKKIKNRHTQQLQNVEQALPGIGSDWGLNVSSAILLSDNDAKATLNSEVRGFDGKGNASNSIGAKSITVMAENVSRTSMSASAYQNEFTDVNGLLLNNKDTGISLPVVVGIQDNTATAVAGGDLKASDAITVEAITRVPWEIAFEPTIKGFISAAFSASMDPNLNVGNLCDSWAQGTATVEEVGAAGSISVMDYTGVADAHVAKDAIIDVQNGDLKVNALNDVVTVNFSGNISSPITMLPWAIWESKKNRFKPDAWGASGNGVAIGGAAVAAHHNFTAKAYVEDSNIVSSEPKGQVTANNVNVDAKNNTLNLTMAASGGKSAGVAIDGTVNVTLTDNVTEAYIGQTNVNAKAGSVKVNATDNAMVAAIGGGVGISSGSVGLGGTVAYNHIDRDTSADINGIVTATDAVEVNAENTGEIVAVSLAGATTYDGNIGNIVNAGGSRGAHVHQDTVNGGIIEIEMQDEDQDGLLDLAEGLLDIGTAGNHNVDNGNDVVDNVANQGQGANEYIRNAKNGFAVAANVAVNRVFDNADAYIAKADTAGIVPVVNADYVRVQSNNDSSIVSASGEASVDLSTGSASTGVAGGFMYNSVDSINNAYIHDAIISVDGNTSNEDEAISIDAINEEEILNIAIGGAVAPKGNTVVGQVGINRIDNVTTASMLDSNIIAGEKIAVNATDKAKIQSYIGSGSGTGKAFVGIGASVGVQDIDATTTAKIENSSIAGTSESIYGDLEVSAQEESEIVSIVGTASGGLANMSGAFSVSANDVDTSTNAYIDSDENIKANAIKVAAKNLANSTMGVGSVSVGKISVGMATSIALSDNVVNAYLKGDDNSDSEINGISANSIDVTADNIYNGDADYTNEDNTTAKTVAIGGGVGTGEFAGTGSVTVNIIDNETKAHIDKGNYSVDGDVNVKANSQAHLFGLAGGVSVGVKAVGVGAAVDTQLLNADTKAYVADEVTIQRAGNISVEAKSIENITSVATLAGISHYFAGAAAANAHDVNVNTEAYIGTDEAEDSKETTISNAGNVSIVADDSSVIKANAGSAAVTVSATGSGVGTLSAVVEVLDKNVKASVGKTNIISQNLTAKAKNVGNVITTANGIAVAAALYGGGLSGSASESIIDYTTDAHIAGGANVNVGDYIIVDSDSSFSHTGEAASIAASTLVSAGLSNDTTVLNTTTLAYIGDNTLAQAKDIDITANNTVNITSTVVAGSGAIVGIDGGVGVNDINNITKAYIGASSNVTANGTSSNDGVTISAKDVTELSGGSGGATIGAAGVGAAINVNVVEKDTQAYIGENSQVNSKGHLSLNAKNVEDILNVTIQGTGGLAAGVAGAVGVHDLDVITKAYSNGGVKINQSSGYESGGNISFNAEHALGIDSTVVGAAFAGMGIGTAVDVANVVTQTNAYVGDNNAIKNTGSIDITAQENFGTEQDKIDSTVVSGTVAGGSINAGVSVYSYGSGMSDEDKKLLNVENQQSIDAYVNDYINKSNIENALDDYVGNTVASKVEQKVANRTLATNITNTSTNGNEGTAAKIGSGSNIASNGNVSVNATNSLASETNVGTGVAGCLALGASIGVVNDNSKINSIIDDNANISRADTFTVIASNNSNVQGLSVAPAVGINAGAAASLDFNNNASVLTNIGSGVRVSANDINVTSRVEGNMYAHATGVGVGISGVGLVVALVDSNEDATTNIGENISFNAENGTISIDASSDVIGKVKAEAGAGGVIDGAVTVTQIDLNNDTNVNVGSTGTIKAKSLTIKAAHNDESSHENISAGAGLASGEGSDSRTNITSNVNVNIGSKNANPGSKLQITTSNLFDVDADNSSVIEFLDTEEGYNSLSAGAALASGTGIVNRTNIIHNTNVNIDDVKVNANGNLDSSKLPADINAITIDAHSNIVSKDYQYIGTGAAIEAAHISDKNIAVANTKIDLGSNAEFYVGDTIKANSTKTENDITTVTHGYVDVGGGSISIGACNDAVMVSSTAVNVWGLAGYAGTDNVVEYVGDVDVNINSDIETANGDVRIAAGRDSAGNTGIISLDAESLLANNTGIPISVHPEPEANIDMEAQVTVGGASHIKSDGDIHLFANNGYVHADGYSEVNDWCNTIGDAFSPNQSVRGKETVEEVTNVEVMGTVETGIHRKQSITIGGSNNNSANWHTNVERTSGIAFEYSGAQELKHQLSEQLEKLRELRAEYISDPKTVSAYDKEIKQVQDQMVALGLAYYDNGATFVEYNLSTINNRANMLFSSNETTPLMSKVDDLIATYSTLANKTTTSAADKEMYSGYVTKLNEFKQFVQEKVDALEAFLAVNGNTITSDGKFMVGENEVNSYVKNGNEFTFQLVANAIAAFPASNNKITLDDIEVKLGNIYVEGSNLYGSGRLLAQADAEVNIINNSPNDLVVNDIKIVGTRSTDERINEGANIIFNDIFVNNKEDVSKHNEDKSKSVAFAEIKNNKNTSSIVTIQNNFDPSEYLVKDIPNGSGADPSEKVFAASDITIAEGARIYNQHGGVSVTSDYGDVYSYGSIDADTVSINVNNGSYVQDVSDDNRIVNVGGDPGAIHNGSSSLDAGIFANGNVVINARYVNINSTIQSGRDEWTLHIPYFQFGDVAFGNQHINMYYYENGVQKFTTASEIARGIVPKENIDDGLVYFKKSDKVKELLGSAYEHLSYDVNNERFVLDGLSIQGGSVEITGTILNTSSNGNGKIIAMDGSGSIIITNKSAVDLEIRNVNVGEGVDGIIKITDLDRETGNVIRTTTYTRNGGKVNMDVVVESGAEVPISTTTEYKPANDLYYIWQTGQDQSTVTEYHYSDKKAVIWWEDGNFSDDDLEDMDVVSVTTGDKYDLPEGTLISGTSKLNDGSAETETSKNSTDPNFKQYTITITTDTSEPYDERVETHRTWYTLGIQKIYDHWFKVKEGTTTITQNSLKANNPIEIGFIGNDEKGLFKVTGNSADVIFNGVINNVNGSTEIVADDILQGANGYVKSRNLILLANNNVGEINNTIQTNASYLTGKATNGAFAVEVLHNDVVLGRDFAGNNGIEAGTTAHIEAAGNISQANSTLVSAKRIELNSQTGSIGTSGEALNINAGKGNGPEYGLKAQAADDIYITNTNGDLYLDSVISNGGDVVLKTNGSFIDNNNTDEANSAANELLKKWENARVLEDTQKAANFQKEMLCNMADANYNRYQFLKKYANANGRIVLSETDKQALTKLGYNAEQITNLVVKLQAEYASLRAMGASDAWTPEALTAYKQEIRNGSYGADSSIYANADLSKEQLTNRIASVNFLTKDQLAEVLVGSTYAQKALVTSVPNDINTNNIDTVYTTKGTPNVKGSNITLESTVENGSIGSSHVVETTKETIDDLLKKDFSKWDDVTVWDKDSKEIFAAWKSAERGDIVTDVNGNMKITVVDAIEVSATGEINAKTSGNGDVFVNSAETMNVGTVVAGDELRLKSKGSINAESIEAGGRVVFEASGGTIGKGIKIEATENNAGADIDFVKVNGANNLIARAKNDIKLTSDGDLGVDIIYSEGGKIIIDLDEADGTSGNLTSASDGINIKGDNVTLTGIATAGTNDNKVGIAVDGGVLQADIDDTAHITTYETMNGAKINAAALDVLNKGNLTRANFVASDGSKASTFTNTGAFLNSKVTAQGNLNVMNLETGSISTPDGEWDLRSELTSKSQSLSYTAGPNTETYAVILNAAKDVDVNVSNDADIYSISAGDNVKITAQQNLDAGTITAQNVTADVAEDFAVGKISVEEDMHITVGNDMRVTNMLSGKEVHIDVANTFSGQNIIADVIDVDANVINSLYASVSGNRGNTISLSTESVDISAEGSIDIKQTIEDTITNLTIGGLNGASTSNVIINVNDGNPLMLTNSNIDNLLVNSLNDFGIRDSIIGNGKIFAAMEELDITMSTGDSLNMSLIHGIQINGLRKLNKKYRTLTANIYANYYSSKQEQQNALDGIKNTQITFAEFDKEEEEYESF